MSTNRKVWTDGEAITTPELQRSADAACYVEDRAHEVLMSPQSLQKRVMPLSEETASVNPRILVVPGATSGRVKMRPAKLLAGGVSLPLHLNMTHTQETEVETGTGFASNSSGSTRHDLVYATVSFGTTVSASRKVKSITDGSISTQTLTLETKPQVTVSILQGTASLPALPSDPGDGSAYNFSLADVSLANGYTAGSAIAQSAIAQTWDAGAIEWHRHRKLRPAIPSESARKPDVFTAINRRGFGHALEACWKYTTSGQSATLDSSIDWRKRFVRITLARAGGNADPNNNTQDGGSFGVGGGFIADSSTGTLSIIVNTKQFDFGVGLSGQLIVVCQTAPTSGTDHWYAWIEASDRFEGANQ